MIEDMNITEQRKAAEQLDATWKAYLTNNPVGADAFMLLLDKYDFGVLLSSIKRTARKQLMSAGQMSTKQLVTYLQSSAVTASRSANP